MEGSSNRTAIDSLSRGIDLLEILAERGSVRLAELPELLGVSRATAFRVVRTLRDRGYVDHVVSEHVYRLGPGPTLLGSRSRAGTIARLADFALVQLRDTTGETANLALLQGGSLIYASILESTYALRTSAAVGETVPLHSTALGKAILSALPGDAARKMAGAEPYERLTENAPGTWDELLPHLALARERGYGIDNQETDPGATCVASTITDATGYPLGGLSISGATARLPAERIDDIAELLIKLCSELSDELKKMPSGAAPSK